MQFFKAISASFILSLSAQAFANNAVLVQAPIEKVFVPTGFDDNDKVELIVRGQFPNSCYKMGPTSATVNEAKKVITIAAQAYFYKGAVCASMKVPFIKSVELVGGVPAGQYKIEVTARPTAISTPLVVKRATRADADDYLYAAVQSATIEDARGGGDVIVLKGQHPFLIQGCVKFDGIKTNNASGVLVVQPITHIENDSAACTGSVNNRFEYRVPLKPTLSRGEYLMHVRVLDGSSVNQLVEIE